jgi:hypothetical protein
MMDLETLRAYLLSLPGAVATYPFGPQPLVVGGLSKGARRRLTQEEAI